MLLLESYGLYSMPLHHRVRNKFIICYRKIKKRIDRIFRLGTKKYINPHIYDESYLWCWRLLIESYNLDREMTQIGAKKIAMILTLDRQYDLFSEKKLNRLVKKFGTKYGVPKEEN
ncbi:hypothetical protein [Butyrivibrio sp. WCD3002]|uniref:hypothetical protein n=1 Tax=Butyrivibrio sp. WCD3002 TaxID=1280676 RepID=UPI00047A602F|nr:hypothetical protein [Butyrivibrio sp. WCD3002]